MSPFSRKLKMKKTPALSKKVLRLPDGTLYKCEKKVREQNINDLLHVASKIGFERDLQFFFISKNADGFNLLPACFPRKPTALVAHISKIYFLYNLCEQSVAKCLSFENPKDLSDTHLLNDVVLTNRNNLQSNPEDANAAKAILDSEDAVIRLLTTLLSLPELTTQWYRVKDQTGKVCQLGITCNGLVLRPEFDGIETGRVSWTDIGSPRVQRANIRLPLMSTEVVTEPTVSSFVQCKKGKRSKLTRKKPTRNQTTVREYGDVESSQDLLDAGDGAELVFSASDPSTAKRIAYQLNCSRSYALSEGFQDISAPSAIQPSSGAQASGAFARFNRQFRDTFRRVAKPFSKKSKKTVESEEEKGNFDKEDHPVPEVPDTSVSALTVDETPRVCEASQPAPGPLPQTPSTTSQNATSPPTVPVPALRTSVKTPQLITEVSTAVTSNPISTTAVSGGSNITQKFHVSHNLTHGTSFQTHGSTLPVSSRMLEDIPAEPIGVVAAGEADFTLDECEDRILHSLPSPVFDSAKMTRTSPITAVPGSPKTYSLGIKSTLIQPVTPTSPSSMTSFGANSPPPPLQSPPGASLSSRFDRSPTNDSTAQVSTILSQCVKNREGPPATDPTMQAQMDANREFCASVLAKMTTPTTNANSHVSVLDSASAPSPSTLGTAEICKTEKSNSDVAVVKTASVEQVEPALNTNRQSSTPPVVSSKSEITSTHTPSPNSTKLVEGNQKPMDSLSSFGQTDRYSTSSVLSESHNSIVDTKTPVSETPSTTASQLYTFSSTTSTHNGKMSPTKPLIPDVSEAPVKTAPLSSFGQSQTLSEVTTDGNAASEANTEDKISPSTSFESRLKPPSVSVSRSNSSTNADAFTRTPEFPTPYRPVVSGLLAPKIMPPSLPNSEHTAKQSVNGKVSGKAACDVTQTNPAPAQTAPTSSSPTNLSQMDEVSSNPSASSPTRVSGIKPPSVKVPGSTLDQPQAVHATRPVSTNSSHAVTNGSSPTAGLAPGGRFQETAVSQAAYTSSHIKQPEVMVPASGIQPPSVAVTASLRPHTGSGLVRPSTIPHSGSSGLNGASSHLPKSMGAPTGIRPPSRVPKPNINRAVSQVKP